MKKKLASCEVRGGSEGGDETTGLLINPQTCGHRLGLREGECGHFLLEGEFCARRFVNTMFICS